MEKYRILLIIRVLKPGGGSPLRAEGHRAAVGQRQREGKRLSRRELAGVPLPVCWERDDAILTLFPVTVAIEFWSGALT